MRVETDGTRSVMVCGGVDNGQPQQVFALHPHRTSVVIDPTIKMVSAGAISYTESVASAFADEKGVVHVSAPRSLRSFTVR